MTQRKQPPSVSFDGERLTKFIHYNGNWTDAISGRVYYEMDTAKQSAFENLKALGGDYDTPLSVLRQRFRDSNGHTERKQTDASYKEWLKTGKWKGGK